MKPLVLMFVTLLLYLVALPVSVQKEVIKEIAGKNVKVKQLKCHKCAFTSLQGPCKKTKKGWSMCKQGCMIIVLQNNSVEILIEQDCATSAGLGEDEVGGALGCKDFTTDPTTPHGETTCICNKSFCNEGLQTAKDNKQGASSTKASSLLILIMAILFLNVY